MPPNVTPWTAEEPLSSNLADAYVEADYWEDDYVEGFGGSAPLVSVWTAQGPKSDPWL